MFPNDLNSNDTVFGGLIMAHMDRLAAVVADRHAGGVTVTVSVDAVHFLSPARRGDVLVMHASMNRAWRSSMEVGVRVEARKPSAAASAATSSRPTSASSRSMPTASRAPVGAAAVTRRRRKSAAIAEAEPAARQSLWQNAEQLKQLRASSPRSA